MFEEDVAGWLRRVELTVGSERQAAIVESAQEVAAVLRGDQALGLVLLAHSVREESAFAVVRDAVSARDTTFGCVIDDLETHIIAGIYVAALLEQDSDVASAASQAVLSAKWSEMTSAVADLPALAATALRRRSEAYRDRSTLAITTSLAAATNALPPVLPEDDGPATHNEVRPISAAMSKTIDAVKRSLDQAATRINNRFLATDEELDVLWWAFGGFSEMEQARWSDRDADRRPLVMAYELSRLLRFPVEPPSAPAILSRLLGSSANQSVRVASAIEDVNGSGIELAGHEGHPLLPLLSSVKECNELQGKAAWRESVSRWGIVVSRDVSPFDLAQQALREFMLTQHTS